MTATEVLRRQDKALLREEIRKWISNGSAGKHQEENFMAGWLMTALDAFDELEKENQQLRAELAKHSVVVVTVTLPENP